MGSVRSLGIVALGALALVGCMRPKETEDERIRREAAQDTREIKQDAREFAADTKKEALQARRQVKDIVAGVRQGLADPAAPAGSSLVARQVDINHATGAELQSLPGVSAPVARRIVANRPYASTDELVKKARISQAEYDRIAGSITAE